MSEIKLKKYMDDLSNYINRPSLTAEERIIWQLPCFIPPELSMKKTMALKWLLI